MLWGGVEQSPFSPLSVGVGSKKSYFLSHVYAKSEWKINGEV